MNEDRSDTRKLVYLDSAQFVWLENDEGIGRIEFHRRWRATGATLALSFHHVQEVAQLEEEESVERRLSIFADFSDVCFSFRGSGSVNELEAQVALLRLLGKDVGTATIHCEIFALSDASQFANSTQSTAMPTTARCRTVCCIWSQSEAVRCVASWNWTKPRGSSPNTPSMTQTWK